MNQGNRENHRQIRAVILKKNITHRTKFETDTNNEGARSGFLRKTLLPVPEQTPTCTTVQLP